MSFKEIKTHKNEVNSLKENTGFNPDKRVNERTAENTLKNAGIKSFNPDKRIDRNNRNIESMKAERLDSYYTTPEERLKQNPREERFEGERGNSLCLPENANTKEILDSFGLKGIEYTNGFADFSPATEYAVKIDHMIENRQINYSNALKAVAEKWNQKKKDGRTDWKASEVDIWKKKEDLAFHECEDLHTCQFVPFKVHNEFGHTGGHLEAKIRDGGGKFDD